MGQFDNSGWVPRVLPEDAGEYRVTLVATHTIDRWPASATHHARDMPGGPAYYIGNALKRCSTPYRLVTGQTAVVDVLPGVHGEEYVIPPLQRIPLPSVLRGRAAILSPIMGEIDPQTVPPVEGMLVVDLQGFVREPNRPTGQVSRRVDLRQLLSRASVVKASRGELALLDDASRAQLDATLLVVTCGSAGAIIRERGHETHIAARQIHVANTIGAGDTFLAAFVSSLLDGNLALLAGTEAARFTEAFLARRLSPADARP